MLKNITIDELVLGMFVSELDISWVKSPFFRHKRLIAQQQDIELLKKAGVKKLVIDLTKSTIIEATSAKQTQSQGIPPAQSTAQSTTQTLVQPSAGPVAKHGELQVPKVELHKEIHNALKIQQEIVDTVAQMNQSFEAGDQVSVEKLTPIVNKTLESIDNNSQAIMALLHEGRQDSRLVAHSFGVFALVLMLASHLDFAVEDQETIGLAALMHDAGWSKLPSKLMSKGKPYTPQEKTLAMQHIPILQKLMAHQKNIPDVVQQIMYQHHECLDGSGYPMQLKGDAIHPWARLLAVCNEYDEKVHGLGESPGMTPQNALSTLYHDAEKNKLDSQFTSQLISLLGVYPLGSSVELSDGSLAVVVELNIASAFKPNVLQLYNPQKQALAEPALIELANAPLKIRRVLDTHGKDKLLDPHKILFFSSDMLLKGRAVS